MKKEDLQSSHQGTNSAENRNENRDTQRSQSTHLNQEDQKDVAHQAGLGRDRMTDIEEMGGLGGRDDYAGGDNDDMSNQNINERTDR